MSPAAALVLSLLAASGRVDEVRDEEARAREQRLAQQTALTLLKSQKVGVDEVMGLYGQLARQSAVRAKRLEREMRVLRRRVELAAWEESVARGVLDDSLGRLGPKLVELYRLSRRGEVGALLSAEDLAGLLWRARAYGTLMKSDLAALDEARSVADFQTRSLARLDGLKAAFAERLDEARDEAEEAKAGRAELDEALTLVQAEASASDRVLRELKSNEAQLTRALTELTERAPTTGFGALRGKLPYPARGFVERGFGNVVNPRFNTVTLHKGIDLRAGSGQPVKAIADGRIAYAGWLQGYGYLLIVEHEPGYHTVLAHLVSLEHALGDAVTAGEVIGHVGDSGSTQGAYLYFELRQRGIAIDPVPWLKVDED